jgi:predicted histone-like DNA-binding protein
MAIFYNLIRRKNPRDLSAPEKVYASVITSGKAELADLAAEIAENTTINAAEVEAALKLLEPAVIRRLSAGQSAGLGGLCTFYPRISSEGAESEEAFNANTHIRKVGVSVRPGKALQEQVSKAGLQRR